MLLDYARLDWCFKRAWDRSVCNSVLSTCSMSKMVQEERLLFDVSCLLAIPMFHGISVPSYSLALPLNIRRLRGERAVCKQESECPQVIGQVEDVSSRSAEGVEKRRPRYVIITNNDLLGTDRWEIDIGETSVAVGLK